MKKLIGLGVISPVLMLAGGMVESTSAAAVNPKQVNITARRYGFDPGVITLKKGEPVVLVVRSEDVAHGLRIRELGIEVKVPRGGTGEVRFTPEKVGDFVGHCFVFCGSGHGTMALTVHVVG